MHTISQAAANAISTFTAVAGIDDDGDPIGIGAWHLIQDLYEFAETHASGPDRLIEAARKIRGAERTYLIQVEDSRANATITMPVSIRQYEVSSVSLEIACLTMINEFRGHPSIAQRQMTAPYTGETLPIDEDRYEAVGFVRAGNMADVRNGAANAIASRLVTPTAFVPSDLPMNRTAALDKAFEVFGDTLRDAGKLSGDRRNYATLLAAVMTLAERHGEDPDKLINDALTDRAELQPPAAMAR